MDGPNRGVDMARVDELGERLVTHAPARCLPLVLRLTEPGPDQGATTHFHGERSSPARSAPKPGAGSESDRRRSRPVRLERALADEGRWPARGRCGDHWLMDAKRKPRPLLDLLLSIDCTRIEGRPRELIVISGQCRRYHARAQQRTSGNPYSFCPTVHTVFIDLRFNPLVASLFYSVLES